MRRARQWDRIMPRRLARRRWLVATAAILPELSAGRAWAADAEATARQVAETLDLQTNLPTQGADTASVPFDLSWLIPDDVARLILWGSVIIGAAMILWAMRDSLPGFSRSRRLKAAE